MRAAAAAGAIVALALMNAGMAVGADGAKIFAEICQACHQTGGVGAPGLAPPLVSPVIAAAAGKQKDYPVLVIINGLAGSIPLADGSSIGSAMPPQQNLSDDDVAAVVNYVFHLNHMKTVVQPADVARLRAQSAGSDELKRIRADLMQ